MWASHVQNDQDSNDDAKNRVGLQEGTCAIGELQL